MAPRTDRQIALDEAMGAAVKATVAAGQAATHQAAHEPWNDGRFIAAMWCGVARAWADVAEANREKGSDNDV